MIVWEWFDPNCWTMPCLVRVLWCLSKQWGNSLRSIQLNLLKSFANSEQRTTLVSLFERVRNHEFNHTIDANGFEFQYHQIRKGFVVSLKGFPAWKMNEKAGMKVKSRPSLCHSYENKPWYNWPLLHKAPHFGLWQLSTAVLIMSSVSETFGIKSLGLLLWTKVSETFGIKSLGLLLWTKVSETFGIKSLGL